MSDFVSGVSDVVILNKSDLKVKSLSEEIEAKEENLSLREKAISDKNKIINYLRVKHKAGESINNTERASILLFV